MRSLQRNERCRITDAYSYRGMRVIFLENDLLRVGVLVDKGSDIFEFTYKPAALNLLFVSPAGIRRPDERPSIANPAGEFVDFYEGGWQEILPNGGAPLGQHGEISLLPWEYAIIQDDPDEVAATLWVRPLRFPLLLTKTLRLRDGEARLYIEERLTNEAGESLDLMWGHHLAFGIPFLREGAVIDAPGGRLLIDDSVPDYEPRRFKPGSVHEWPYAHGLDGKIVDGAVIPGVDGPACREMMYLTGLPQGWVAMTNPSRRLGVALRWDLSRFKYLWIWQELRGGHGYPWYGRTHVVGLEPWTSYPTAGLQEAIRRGTQLALRPGETITAWMDVRAFAGLRRVTEVEEERVLGES